MPKSRSRKKKGGPRKDLSGKVYSKKRAQEIQRKRTMRHMTLSQACESLKSSELEEIINNEPFGGELSYIETKLDDNGVPVAGETKSIKIGGESDKSRLETILRHKQVQEQAANKEEKKED